MVANLARTVARAFDVEDNKTAMRTYKQTLNDYRRLLAEHPGEALISGDGLVALLDPETGHLVWTTYVDGPDVVDATELNDFDSSAWGIDAWDGETPEQTASFIEQPRFVKLPSHFIFPSNKASKAEDTELRMD